MEGATEVVSGQLKSGSRTSDSWVLRLPSGAYFLLTSLFIDDFYRIFGRDMRIAGVKFSRLEFSKADGSFLDLIK